MKFSTAVIALSAAAISSVSADTDVFTLKVQSSNSKIDGTKVAALHEGAGINYAFVGSPYGATNFRLNDTGILSTAFDGTQLQYAGLIMEEQANHALEIGVLTEPGVGHFQQGFGFNIAGRLAANGSADHWYACDNIGDAYHYEFSAVAWFADDKPDSSLKCSKIDLVRDA